MIDVLAETQLQMIGFAVVMLIYLALWITFLVYGKSYKSKTNLDIFDNKILIDGETTFYLCKSYTCKMPTNSIKDINNQIKDLSY